MEIVPTDCSFSAPTFGCVVELVAGRIITEHKDHIAEVHKGVADGNDSHFARVKSCSVTTHTV